MTNHESIHYIQAVIELIEDLSLEAHEKIAILESSAEIIRNNVKAEAMRVALFNALRS